jgi:hypothetical protein
MAALWHPAIAAFVHPCTSDGGNAKGLQEQSSPRNSVENVPLKAAALSTGCRIKSGMTVITFISQSRIRK